MEIFWRTMWNCDIALWYFILGICNITNCINGTCNAMGYCDCMDGFTGETCDMRKIRAFYQGLILSTRIEVSQ